MSNQPNLIISETDFNKITALISGAHPDIAEPLAEELNRATIVQPSELPNDVIAMNTQTRFIDLSTNKETVVTLVYPHDAKLEDNKISILAPVGSALIGLRVGQVINWPMPNGKEKRLKVVSVKPSIEN